MKVLILFCSTGGGHKSSALALRTVFQKYGVECDDADFVPLVCGSLSRIDSFLYLCLINLRVFDLVYKLSAFSSKVNRRVFGNLVKTPIYAVLRLFSRRLHEAIDKGGYDAVVSTHLFPAMALTSLRRNSQLRIPVLFVTTDYTCYPLIGQTECDAYIIPHIHLFDEFVLQGLQPQKLYSFGIPVDVDKRMARDSKTQARKEFCDGIGLNGNESTTFSEDSHWFLIMGGSMGYGPIKDLLKGLYYQVGRNDRIICVCGGNVRLASSLKREYADEAKVIVLEYTDQVALLMCACDVLLSKPGGVTSYEAALYGLPLVHTQPMSGIEKSNANFFRDHGMSFFSKNIQEQISYALLLCQDTSLRSSMLVSQRENTNLKVGEQILELVMELQASKT